MEGERLILHLLLHAESRYKYTWRESKGVQFGKKGKKQEWMEEEWEKGL